MKTKTTKLQCLRNYCELYFDKKNGYIWAEKKSNNFGDQIITIYKSDDVIKQITRYEGDWIDFSTKSLRKLLK